MAYWQNGKLYLHGSTQSVAATVGPHRELGRRAGLGRGARLRVHGRRLRQQGRGRRLDGHSGAALEEGQRARDDAHQPRGGELHRARTDEHDGARQGRLRQGRPHHGARSLHRPGLGRLRADGRLPIGRQRRVADLPARRDAAAGDQRHHQHTAAHAAAFSGADAGQRHHGTGHHEGRQAAWHRPGGHPPSQFARGQGCLRRATPERPAPPRHERVRERRARPRRRRRSGGTNGRPPAASGADRRCVESVSPSGHMAQARWASTAS